MIENNSRSPMEECDEDPFWENLLDKYPIIEDAISILPWVEKAVEYILEEGRKRGVIQEKDDQAAEGEYAAWLRHKEGVEDTELDIKKFVDNIRRMDRNRKRGFGDYPEEESPSELHVRQQEWRDKHYEKWMDDKPGEDE